jgi:hypothetical protein
MDKEAWRTISFVVVGLVAAVVSTGIDLSFGGGTRTLALLALILVSVFIIGFGGTYLAEYFGTIIEAEGGRLRVYLKSLWIYIITWFVVYTLMYNEFVFPG